MRQCIDGVFGEIDSLPGCSQIGVSHAVFVPRQERGQGTGTMANFNRTHHMRHELGYDYAMCTVSEENIAQIRVLEKCDWKLLDKFYSSKTCHNVYIYGKKV